VPGKDVDRAPIAVNGVADLDRDQPGELSQQPDDMARQSSVTLVNQAIECRAVPTDGRLCLCPKSIETGLDVAPAQVAKLVSLEA